MLRVLKLNKHSSLREPFSDRVIIDLNYRLFEMQLVKDFTFYSLKNIQINAWIFSAYLMPKRPRKIINLVK